jgi:hypothetical protein
MGEPTPGVRRAAERIADCLPDAGDWTREELVAEIMVIVTEDSGLAELVEAAEELLDEEQINIDAKLLDRFRAALAKARGD